ncbi:hypothetical protein N9I68_04415, partial [Bacteroidia bacterium]|nr:hypothetical protein [Bacteroidia bacterium]
MRVLLFLLACTVLQLVSPGQSFDWVSGDTISVALEPNTYAELKMRQNNLTTDTLNLGVEIIHKDIPESWDGMVCLQGLCLGLIPEEREKYTMLPLHGEQKGFVRLTINPYDGTEQAKLRIRVYDIDRPIYSDTATWLLNSNTLGIKKLMDENTLEIYPNPTRGP